MNQSFVSERTATLENKPFPLQIDSAVLLSTYCPAFIVVRFFCKIKNVSAGTISKKFSKYSALVWVLIVNSDWFLYNMQ